MKKNLTMQLLPLWLLAFFFFASVPIKAQTTPKASITKLIGCLPAPDADKAEVKITVDQDKVTDYTYNFNGTYTTNNVGKLTKGAKTILVKKTAGGQVYSVNINIPDKTATPTFTPIITYNCNGTADVLLTTNQGTYNYTYTYLSNTHNSPYFTGLAVGQQHTVTVKYTAPPTTKSIVFYDDFGKYDGGARSVKSPYVNQTIFFDPMDGTNQVKPDGSTRPKTTNDSYYAIGRRAELSAGTPNNSWILPNDKDKDPNGRYLWYNVALTPPAEKTVYKRKAKVRPGLPIEFSAYVYNPINAAVIPTGYVPDVSLKIFRSEADFNSDTPMYSSDNTESIPKETNLDNWTRMSVTTNVRNTDTELIFVIYINGGGNDLCVDNVLVTQPSITCEQTVTVPVNVVINTNVYSTTVAYNCAANNATITVTPSVTTGYDYTYSLNGGTPQTSGSFVKNAGSYTITVTSKVKGSKILFKEDFGSGGTYLMPTSVIPTPFVGRLGVEGYPSDILAEGNYQIANQGNLVQRTTWNWLVPLDRTSNGTKTDGRYLAFNYGANATSYFYQQDIQVTPNKPITIEYYVYNLNKSNVVSNFPNIETTFWNKATNTVITSSTKVSGNITGNTHNKDWRKVTHTFTPPLGVTDLQLRFRNTNNDTGANDFAIDDILVTQAYDTCTTTLTATVAPKVTRAFAGVTRLIGCGTGANANKAEVTIANVEGGTGAYEYNFDGTWGTANTSWLAAGTHTVSVRAVGTGNGCQYDMSVTVPAALAQPTIKTEVFYACDGKAILNVGVENPDPALKYLYSLDGAAYTTTYVYTNVASGTHLVGVKYDYITSPQPVLLFKDDFGNGAPRPLPGPASDYGLTYGTTYPIGAGFYQIVSQADAPSYWALLTPFNTCAVRSGKLNDRWVSVYDHTSGGTDPTGRFYMSDFKGTQADGDLFYKREVNVLPGSDINYEFYALNLFRQDRTTSPWSPYPEALKPNVVVRLVAPNGTVVASTTTGEMPNSVCATNLADNLKNWRKYEGKLNVGTYTKLTIEIRSEGSAPHVWGNDMALDDITVNMIPKACGQVVSATKVVTANVQDIPSFTVSKTYDCATGKGGFTVTPTATTGFTYTYTLGSTTYTSTTATFTGLTLEQTYTVSVSYQAVSNTVTLLNEDFGTGTVTTSPYVPSKYYFQKLDGSPTKNKDGQTRAGSTTTPRDQDYRVAKELGVVQPFWHTNVKDHTGNTDGRMLFIWPQDAVGEIVYQREISVLPNNDIDYSLWAKYYVVGAGPTGGNPTVQAALYKSLADVAANANAIPVNGAAPVTHTIPGNNVWTQLSYKVKAADVGNVTKLYLVVRDNTVNPSGGNDLALDDIVVTQKLPVCTTSVTATLTKGDVATPTLTLPANLSVICSAPTASATISSWIASATATSTCGTATVTHNYSYPSNLCNVGGAVTVTFSTTDPFGNVVSGTRVITFATMTLTVTPTTLSVPNGALGGTTSSVLTGVRLNGNVVTNTNSVTITFSGLPAGVTTDTQGRIVVPAGTPATSTLVTYKVCEKLNPTNCQTVTSTLVIGTGSLTVTPVTPLTVPNGISGGTTSSVLTGVRLNGNVVTNTNSVTITFSGLPAGVTTDTQGRIVIPAGTPATSTLVTYKVCEKLNPTNCHIVTSTLVIGTGSLTVIPVTPLTVPNGISGGTTSSVLTGVRLNGNVVTNTNSVTISFSGLPAGVTTDTQGRIVVPAGTPATSTLVTYKVCEKLNPTNCQTVTSTLVIGTGSLTVTPVTPLTVPNGITGGTTSSVLTGVRLNGNLVTNTNSVTISFSGLPAGVTTDTQGRIVVPAGTPATSTLVTYKVCEKLNPTNCQTVTSTLVIGTGSLTVTPVTPLTVPNGISGGTTSSVLTGVRLNGNVVTNTNSVTISFSGLPTGVTTDTQGRIVVPAGTPATSTLVTYKVCEKLNPTNCQTVTSTLVIGTGSLTVTPVTPLTVPNGANGGTTSSVLTGVRLNGNVVTNTNSVTITFSGLPAGVTTDTQGRIVIPAGTPATNTLVTYRVCEKLNPTNCQTVTSTLVIGTGSLTVTPVTPLTVPNGISGGTTSTVLTGVRLNGNVVTNTNSVTISFSGLPAGVTTDTQGRIVVPAGTPATSTLVTYKVCEKLNPTNCQTVTSTLVIGTGSLTVTPVTPLTVPNGISGGTTSSVLTGITLNGTTVTNTNSVTISFSGLPTGVTTNTNGQLVIPAGTPAGTHTITYKVCEKLNPTNCQTVTSTLVIGTGSLTVTPVTPLTVPNGISGGTTSSVLTGITLNGATVTNTNSVTISFSGLPTGVTSNTNGQLVIPAGTPAGTHTITYRVCEKLNPTNCQTVTSTLVIGTGSLTVTPVTPLTVPNGISGGTTSSVLTGITLNGTTVTNTNSVTISFSGLPTGVTSNTNGQLVIPANTPAGTHTITYRVCEKLNPTNCQTVTSTLVIGTGSLTVTPVTPLTVPNGISGGTTSSVLTGITLNGATVTNTNSVTISFSGLPTGVTSNTNGQLVIPSGTPAGTHTITYKVCEKLNPTNCQTVTSTLVIGTGSLTVTPVTPLTVPNGISGGTTSSVLTGITLNGTTVTNTNSVTISFSGLPTGVTTDTQGRIVVPAGTPATSTLVTYKVCEKLNPTNCQTVTSTLVIGTGSLTVTPVTPLTVPNGANGGTTSSVLTGVRLNGNVVTNTNSVTISFSGLPTGVTTDTQGRIVVPAGTPATNTLVTYRVCEKLNPTNNCQIVTSTLVIGTGSLTVTPVTPLTVPNGANGGTTSSVLTGVRLNGNVVTNTNSVTISFSGLPAGVTTDTQGRIVVPAGTPATSTLVTYKVCEKLNPTNCQTVTSTLVIGTGSLTVTPVTPLTVPNGISGGTTSSVLTGITLNGTTVTNTNSVTISFSGLPTGVTTDTQGRIVVPAGTPATSTLVTYKVCEKLNPTNCQTVTSTLVIGTGSLTVTPTALTHPNGTQGGTTTGTVLTGVKINGNPVNTASVTITWNSLPPNATGNASGTVTIAPNTPAGTYTISYTVCERLNGNSNCQSVTSQITIGGGNMTVTPTTLTHPNGTQGGTTTGTVLTGVKINGSPVNTASVTITWNSLPPNATGNASGTVTIAPNTPAGTYTISYTVCERLNGNSNCQSVTSQITIGGGSLTVTPTQLVVANGATGGTSVNNVLTGVKINGNPVNTNSVTITWNSLPPGFIGTNSGTVTVPANTPAGTYTVSYTVCERLNQNNNCKTVTSTITVGNGNMIVVPTPITVPNGTIGGTSTPSVLTGVVLNGNSNPAPNTVSITWNTLPPRATGNNDGTVNVAPNTPAGTYTVSYTICEALNSGHCTTVTSTITIGGGVLTVTPVTTLTVANGAQGGTTTSSVLTGVSLNGQPANSQSVTITFTGLPAGVTSNTNGQLVVAPGTPATNTTIYYTVCETLNANNNCHTYSTTLVIGTPNLSVTPRTYTIPDATIGGTTSSVLETVTIDGHTPSSQSVTITFDNLPVGIQTTTSGGFRVPAGTPTGIHTVTYTVCEVLNPDHCVTSIATIAVGNVPVVTPNAFTYTGTATVTTPSILDDDTVGTQSATTGTGGNVVINITSTPTGTVVPSLDANNGRVTIPAGTPPGIYTITYDVCTTATPTACTPGAVVITIPNVPVITPDDMVYTDTTTTTAGNILTNDRVGTQSATAGNGGNVSITVTIPATPKAPGATVPTLNPNTGVVTVPAGTPSGTYTITYKICTTATPTSCDTGVVTITVSGTVTEAPDTNDVTAYTRINTPVTVGVTSSTTVTVSIPSQPANGTAVSNGDGTITYTPNNGFKGTDSFEYSLCNAAGCRTATITVRVTSELIIYNGVSIGGSDKNNHFHIEGIENYPNNTVRIYNRWGVKVFEMSGYNNTTKAFRGVSDARATLEASDNLPQGTYYYIIEYVDEHNKTQTETGWLYLKKN